MTNLALGARQMRWLLAASTLLLVSPFVLPLWQTRMEAPQYKGDEALLVSVYADEVIGDLKEIDTLNQYVGVHLPLEGIELSLLPFAFGGLCALSLVATLLPLRWRRAAARTVLVMLLGISLSGIVVLQYRLYEMGHDRGEQILEGVDDFTPLVVGSIKVANFHARMRVGSGSWLLIVAAVLFATVGFSSGSVADETPAPELVARSPASREPS